MKQDRCNLVNTKQNYFVASLATITMAALSVSPAIAQEVKPKATVDDDYVPQLDLGCFLVDYP